MLAATTASKYLVYINELVVVGEYEWFNHSCSINIVAIHVALAIDRENCTSIKVCFFLTLTFLFFAIIFFATVEELYKFAITNESRIETTATSNIQTNDSLAVVADVANKELGESCRVCLLNELAIYIKLVVASLSEGAEYSIDNIAISLLFPKDWAVAHNVINHSFKDSLFANLNTCMTCDILAIASYGASLL